MFILNYFVIFSDKRFSPKLDLLNLYKHFTIFKYAKTTPQSLLFLKQIYFSKISTTVYSVLFILSNFFGAFFFSILEDLVTFNFFYQNFTNNNDLTPGLLLPNTGYDLFYFNLLCLVSLLFIFSLRYLVLV